jgi:hypothetical protein
MAAWPTLPEVRRFLRLQPDSNEDLVIDSARLAAIDFGVRYLGNDPSTGLPAYPDDTTSLPDAAHQAAMMHSARLYKRRDSIDGTLGYGELGVVQVGRTDPDVLMLYGIERPVVFG